MGIILLLFLFAIFSAIIASNKGKSATKWFFVGLLFGPFGLIVGFLNNENNKSTVNVKVKNIVEQESYYYEIKPNDIEEDWISIKKDLTSHLFPDYEIVRDDNEIIMIESTKKGYIKMFKLNKKDGLYFGIESIQCNSIEFNDNINIAYKEETNGRSKKIENYVPLDNTDKIIKISELYEKGHLSRDEFELQKKKLI